MKMQSIQLPRAPKLLSKSEPRKEIRKHEDANHPPVTYLLTDRTWLMPDGSIRITTTEEFVR